MNAKRVAHAILLMSLLGGSSPMGWPQEQEGTDLPGTRWYLQALGKIGQEESPLANTQITLQFQDRQIEGGSGCNSYIGTYEAHHDGLITITVLGGTDRACFFPTGVMEQETHYLTVLGEVSAFEIESSHLRLFYDDRQSVLTFVALPTTVRPSTWATVKASWRSVP